MTLDGLSIVTTTWNERENIERLIPILRTILRNVRHEIIVVDDSSPDGTAEAARRLADITVKKRREGQSKGLLRGIKLAKYPIIITIDADLESNPKYIPKLLQKADEFDLLVASRTELPRIAERLTSRIMSRRIGISDVFSNFRVYRKETVSSFDLKGGETFGAEFLIIAKRKGFRIGEMTYKSSLRRKDPRIGGRIKSNLRLTWALIKISKVYITTPQTIKQSVSLGKRV